MPPRATKNSRKTVAGRPAIRKDNRPSSSAKLRKPHHQELPLSTRVDMKPSTYLSPVPVVLLSCGYPNEQTNVMTVAWTGTVCSDPPMISVSIRPDRASYDRVKQTGEFVVNLPDQEMAKGTDYCGVRSARDTDKMADLKWTAEPMEKLKVAQAIAQAPLSLGCKVRQTLDLGSHTCFIGEIVSVKVREELLDKKGALHLEDSGLLCYSHGNYYELGRWLGFFGWSLARPEVFRQRKHRAVVREKRLRQKEAEIQKQKRSVANRQAKENHKAPIQSKSPATEE